MTDSRVTVDLDSFEQRLMVKSMSDMRNRLIEEEKPTEDVDELLVKIIEAQPVKKRRRDRESR